MAQAYNAFPVPVIDRPTTSFALMPVMASEELVTVKLLFFAKSRELCGCKEDEIKLQSGATFTALLHSLVNKYNRLSLIQDNLLLALNQEYLDRESVDIVLRERDELAVIPPISGG